MPPQMPQDPYTSFPGLKILSPGEEVAAGLRPPGPLAPAIKPGASPDQNAQAIRDTLNPSPVPQSKGFLAGLKEAALTKREPADAPFQGLFRAAGKLDVATGRKTPEQAEARAKFYGPLTANVAEQALMGNPATRAGRIAGQGVLLGAQRAMEPGATPLNVVANAVLGATTGAVGPLQGTSAGRYGRFAKEQSQKLADWFHKEVPAWAEFTGPRALFKMGRHPAGQDALSAAYQAALDKTKGKIPEGLTLAISEDVARAAGLEVPKATGPALTPAARAVLERAGKLPVGPAAGTIEVNARQLVDALPSFGKERAALKHEAMDALAKVTGGIQELKAANAQYMKGSAWMELSKGLFRKGERFDPVEAQTVLRTRGKEALGPRGMGGLYDLMRGPGEKEIERVTRPLWERALTGAKLGGLGGAATGGLMGTGMGAGLGATAGMMMIPKTAYKNLPALSPSEKAKLLYQLQQAAIQGAAGQYGRPQ